VHARIAREPWQVAAYFGLRARIFAGEQQMFSGSDRDEHDAIAWPIVALSTKFGMDDEVVGVVRIFPAGAGAWYGGRLGVDPGYRAHGGVGTALIECAVSSAHALGCSRFLATVQERNVRYFERHHFRALEALELRNRPHRLMEADLAYFPPSAALAAFTRAA
jgi:putative N-acetyltransferase (TIGR04045 family)